MSVRIEVPFHRASFGQEEIDAVVDVLRSGWITTGPRADEFEKRCAEYLGSEETLALSSGTAALAIAYRLSKFEGEKVVVPSLTFGSCIAELLHLGAIPVLVDIDENTMNLDIEKALDLAVRSGARGIVAVHYAGQPCDMHRLETETAAHSLALVDDACHAFGASSGGKRIGSFDSLSAFSFYATKCITTAEGGLLSTARTGLLKRARVLSLHGMGKDAWKRYSSEGNWFYEIIERGYKANLPDVLAALGIAQLKKADVLLGKRRMICRQYDEAFQDMEELLIPPHKDAESSFHLYPLRIRPELLHISRAEMIGDLKELGVQCSVHFIPIHMHPYFRSCLDLSMSDLEVTERTYASEITLPLFPDMTPEQVDHVISSVRSVVKRGAV